MVSLGNLITHLAQRIKDAIEMDQDLPLADLGNIVKTLTSVVPVSMSYSSATLSLSIDPPPTDSPDSTLRIPKTSQHPRNDDPQPL